MIISHRFRFIFIKTRKTAGTSIEQYLSGLCAPGDILTPLNPPEPGHRPRNHHRLFNPLPEILAQRGRHAARTLRDLRARRCFYNHIPAVLVRARIGRAVWEQYLKFAVIRNPWDRTLSDYWWQRHRRGGALTLDDYFRRGRFCHILHLYTAPDDPRRLLVDRLIRYEHLDEDLAAIFRLVGVPFEGTLGVHAKAGLHQTGSGPVDELSAAQQQVIAVEFKDEIAMHGYPVPTV